MEQRIPPFRLPHRSGRPSTRWANWVILGFFTGILVMLFLQSPLGKVERIQVEGNRWWSEKDLVKQSGLKPGMSFFGWSSDDVEMRLRSIQAVRSVKVSKDFPGTVHIRVTEYPQVAWWNAGQTRLPVLSNGAILYRFHTPATGEDYPVLTGWHDERAVATLAKALGGLSPDIHRDIIRVKPAEHPIYSDLVSVVTREGHLVKVRVSDFREKMALYPAFRDHPRGTLYLMDTTWFIPSYPKANRSTDEKKGK
jgi:cell division protein FtsQ